MSKKVHTAKDASKHYPLLKSFINPSQFRVMNAACRGDEVQFFVDKMIELGERIAAMPKTYGQDGLGDKAIAYLHYFKNGFDFYVTEKDSEEEQIRS